MVAHAKLPLVRMGGLSEWAWLGFVTVFSLGWYGLGGFDHEWSFLRLAGIFPATVMLVMTLAGLVMLQYFWTRNGEITILTANVSGIEYVRRKGRREQRVRILSREVLRIIPTITMRVNEAPRWCGKIVAVERTWPFGHEASKEALDRAAAALERILEIDPPGALASTVSPGP